MKNQPVAWPALRDFLRVPGELTGKGVRIAVVDGEFPNHPDISTAERRTTHIVRVMESEPHPEVFNTKPEPWAGGAHALWTARVATLVQVVHRSRVQSFLGQRPVCGRLIIGGLNAARPSAVSLTIRVWMSVMNPFFLPGEWLIRILPRTSSLAWKRTPGWDESRTLRPEQIRWKPSQDSVCR